MKDIQFTVQYSKMLAPGIYEMKLTSAEPLGKIVGGQFLHMEVPGDKSLLLRRPFCIYKYDETSVTLIIAEVGKGTARIVAMRPGDKVKAIMPIGNGFLLAPEHKRVVLLGGGVGCAPLLSVAGTYPDRTYFSYLGFANRASVMFEDDFASVGSLTICTDDGSKGRAGYPTDALDADFDSVRPDVILTCGSEGLLKAVARLSVRRKVPAYMSGESRMGCGVGACLVCACKVRGEDGVYHNKRACVDGPVFSLEDIEL